MLRSPALGVKLRYVEDLQFPAGDTETFNTPEPGSSLAGSQGPSPVVDVTALLAEPAVVPEAEASPVPSKNSSALSVEFLEELINLSVDDDERGGGVNGSYIGEDGEIAGGRSVPAELMADIGLPGEIEVVFDGGPTWSKVLSLKMLPRGSPGWPEQRLESLLRKFSSSSKAPALPRSLSRSTTRAAAWGRCVFTPREEWRPPPHRR